MTEDVTRSNARSAPIEAFRQAVARYRVEGDAVVFAATNEPFRSRFGTESEAPTLRDWWHRNGLAGSKRDVDAVGAAIAAGDTVETGMRTREGTTYRLRAVPDDGPATGTLTLRRRTGETGHELVGDHIASVVSHDLRNPLDVAKAHARAARETGDGEHFDRLDRAHDRMERIIGDVLTLARGSGAVDATPDVEVAAVARDAWQAVETGDASLSVADDLPRTEADVDRLQRLFENLFRNAVKHGPGAGSTASGTERAGTDADPRSDDSGADGEAVSVRVDSAAGGFAVADDGRGVPADERDRIFEPGYTASGGGTGLGLTIVDRIASAHDWTVAVAESADGGARFEVTGLA